jgi:hypothetical protein
MFISARRFQKEIDRLECRILDLEEAVFLLAKESERQRLDAMTPPDTPAPLPILEADETGRPFPKRKPG